MVFIINLGQALKFSLVPLHHFVAGQRGSLGRDSPSAGLYLWHLRALRLSPSLPAPYERGGLPFLALPPFHAHVASLVLRVPYRGSPVPSTLSRSLGPLAYSGRLVRCPGCPLLGTHLPKPRSQPVNFTPAPLQTGFVPSLDTNNKTTSFL